MLIVLSALFVQLMHTNYYKIVKQLNIRELSACAAQSSLMMVYVNRNMLEQLLQF